MDVEISRGSKSDAGNNGHPYTKMVVTNKIGGTSYTEIKFGEHVRTVLTNPLEYYNDYDHWQTQRVADDSTVSTLADGEVSLLIDTCSVKVLLDLSL